MVISEKNSFSDGKTGLEKCVTDGLDRDCGKTNPEEGVAISDPQKRVRSRLETAPPNHLIRTVVCLEDGIRPSTASPCNLKGTIKNEPG